MLSFFRINDPLRLIAVFLLLVLGRLPYLLEQTLMIPEVNWLTVGEKMALGGTLYIDIWDNIPPFSAGVYWFLHEIFGKNILAHHIIAMILVFAQAANFNALLIRRDLYNEKNYLPAFLYVLLALLSFDCLVLSPTLLALTFLHIIFRSILSLQDSSSDEKIFNIGLLFGVMVMFDLSFVFFVLFILLGFLLFGAVTARQILLLAYGFSLILLLVGFYYEWQGSSWLFLVHYCFNVFDFRTDSLLSSYSIILLLSFPVIFWLLALFQVFGKQRFINFQDNCHRLMNVWAICAVLSFLFVYQFATYRLILLAPMFAFFMTYYFLLNRKRIRAEIALWVLFLGVLSMSYAGFYEMGELKQYLSFDKIKIELKPKIAFQNKKIVVLGNALEYYYQNQLATPYLNWELAKQHFENLDKYEPIIEIYQNFLTEKPEIIIDEAGIVPALFSKMPLLKQNYRISPENSKIYFLETRK